MKNKKTLRKTPAKKARQARSASLSTGVQQVIRERKGELDVLRIKFNDEADLNKLKSEMLSILPGFGSTMLFTCGTMGKTLATIDKARKQLRAVGITNQFRFGKTFFNGQSKFKGITIHRYNTV